MLGLLYAAFLEIGLWAQVDMYGQAGGGLIGGTIVGGILVQRFLDLTHIRRPF
jgi:hypothetical protein